MKSSFLLFSLLICASFFCISKEQKNKPVFFAADNSFIQYTGRIDFSNKKLPRFWSPGVYINARFKGTAVSVILNDEVLYGRSHNYIEVVIDDRKPVRLQAKNKTDTILAATGLSDTEHTITICKNTESNIGYLELVGFLCQDLLKPAPAPQRRMEFVGNSITCGTGSDQSEIPCGKGKWEDQHNAYMSYGPVTARALNSRWTLTSVSGIGLVHSCCNLKLTMPDVFDKTDLRDDSIPWDFSRYQPNVITVCLGQNDGIQDSAFFCSAYIRFIKKVRNYYPQTNIICLTSPMADETLVAVMKKYLSAIAAYCNANGDRQVHTYFFSKRYHNGCDSHPDLAEHQQIAGELTTYVKSIMHW